MTHPHRFQKGFKHTHVQSFTETTWPRKKSDLSTGFNQLLYELCLVNIIKFIPSDFFKTINSYRQF